MTYLSLKSLGLPKNRIIGMGGALDSSRFKYFLSQALGCNANEVEGMVIGAMSILLQSLNVSEEVLRQERAKSIAAVKRTNGQLRLEQKLRELESESWQG